MAYKQFSLTAQLNQILTDASLSPITGSYDQTKTNLVNRIQQRSGLPLTTLNALGISPINFLDTQDIANNPNPVAVGFTIDPISPSVTARVFFPLAPSAAALAIAYCTYNSQTDTWAYIGKMTITANTATVHTWRGLVVDDNSASTTGWSIHAITTNATAANGGYFYAPNINASDFTPAGGTVIPAATTGNTQASKVVFWMQETGGTNLLTAALGCAIDTSTKTIFIGNTAASPAFYKFTYSTAISTVSAAGVTSDCWNFKTGANAALGTALATNVIKLATPKSGALSGQKCIYIASVTAGFHFLTSDLSSTSTTLPSLVTWNKLGTGTDYSTATWSLSTWSNLLDCEFMYSTSGFFLMKRAISNDPNARVFGKNDPTYAEIAGVKDPVAFAGITIPGIFMGSGVLMAISTVVGQRGIYAIPVAADQYFTTTYSGVVPPSFIITPVVSIQCAQALANAMIVEYTIGGTRPIIQYRTSNFSSFSLSDTWTTLPNNNNLASVGGLSNITQLQCRILFSNIGDYGTNAQLIYDLILAYVSKTDTSANWRIQQDTTSLNGASPVTIGAKQVTAYSGGSQTIYFNLYDNNLNLITQLNTSTHYAQFKKSTDGGVTFSPMASANDYTNTGAQTTVIQLNWASPVAGVTVVAVRDVSY